MGALFLSEEAFLEERQLLVSCVLLLTDMHKETEKESDDGGSKGDANKMLTDATAN
jgi:hypothetical protein